MRYINMVNILVLMFLVGCKQYEFETDTEAEARVAQAAAAVVAQKAAEEISKLTGKGVEEIKALSKEDLEKLAKEVKEHSEKFRDSARGHRSTDKEKKTELVKEIKSTAEKFEEAFKTLVGAGYSGDNGVAGVLVENIAMGLKKLGLVEKLVEIANGSGSNDGDKKDAMKKAVEDFGSYNAGTCSNDFNGRTYPLNNGSNKCMKNLMESVSSVFSRSVEDSIREELKTASDKFNSSLQLLAQAAQSLSSAAGSIANLF